MARTTQSPIALAKAALAAGRQALPDYAHRFSPHKFTQPQLFALLALRQFPLGRGRFTDRMGVPILAARRGNRGSATLLQRALTIPNYCISAARTVLRIRMAVVTCPTPPGTGVMAPAT